MMNYKVVNILDMIATVGEDAVSTALSKFSCSRNMEIENFVRKNAIDFAKQKMSITYLVYGENGKIAAIFTLTHKALELSNENLSNTMRKKIQKHSKLDENTNSFTVSAFLIAQFGKNDNFVTDTISGNKLMDFTFEVLSAVQYDIGGCLVYLECEENEKLLNFYSSEPNFFKPFNERYSDDDETKYIQLLKIF